MNGKWKRNEPKNAHSKHIATNIHYFFFLFGEEVVGAHLGKEGKSKKGMLMFLYFMFHLDNCRLKLLSRILSIYLFVSLIS